MRPSPQPHPAANRLAHGMPVPAAPDIGKERIRAVSFMPFAMQKRDRLGVLACVSEAEAQICLDALKAVRHSSQFFWFTLIHQRGSAGRHDWP